MGGGRKPAHHRDEHTTLGRVHFPGESRLSETHLPAGQLQRTGGHERQFAKLHKHRCILARRKRESTCRQLCLRTGRQRRRLPICRSPRSGKRHTDDVSLRDNDSPKDEAHEEDFSNGFYQGMPEVLYVVRAATKFSFAFGKTAKRAINVTGFSLKKPSKTGCI